MTNRSSSLTPRSKVVRITSQQSEQKAEEKKEKKTSKLTNIVPQLALKKLGASALISPRKKPTKQNDSEAAKSREATERSSLETFNFFSPLVDSANVSSTETGIAAINLDPEAGPPHAEGIEIIAENPSPLSIAAEKPSVFQEAKPSSSIKRSKLDTILSPREKKKLPPSKGSWKAPSEDADLQERDRQFPPPATLVRQQRVLRLGKFGRNSSLPRPEDANAHQSLTRPPIALHTPADVAEPGSGVPPEAAELLPEPIGLRSPANVGHVVNAFAEWTLKPNDAGSSTGSEDSQHN